MTRHLIVAATAMEIRPLLDSIGIGSSASEPLLRGGGVFDALVTGVGQMQTAFHLGQALSAQRYGSVLNLGIAGSFSDQYPRCSLVQIVEEELADLGAEGEGRNLDLFEMKLLDPNAAPFKNGALNATGASLRCLDGVPRVRSVTVNKVLHCDASIQAVQSNHKPDVINMEGAAVFYVCANLGVPAISVRAISDKVGRRDKSQWDIPGAVRNLCQKAEKILVELAD